MPTTNRPESKSLRRPPPQVASAAMSAAPLVATPPPHGEEDQPTTPQPAAMDLLDSNFEGLAVPSPMLAGPLRWADFDEEEAGEECESATVSTAHQPASVRSVRSGSESCGVQLASPARRGGASSSGAPEGEDDGSDWTPPTARGTLEERFPDSPPRKPDAPSFAPTPVDGDVVPLKSHDTPHPNAAPPPPSYRRGAPKKSPEVLRHPRRDMGPLGQPEVRPQGQPALQQPQQHPTIRRYDPYALPPPPPMQWAPSAHAANLEGRLTFRPYHPGALAAELPIHHTHDVPSRQPGSRSQQTPAPTTRLFIGHWWLQASTCVVQWLLDEFVTNPEALALTGHCIAYEPQLHFNSQTGVFRGCMHARVCCLQPVLVVQALHHRVLFDHSGVWYAETPEQQFTLMQYCGWVKSLPQWKRVELLRGLPPNPLAVEFASNQ